MCFDGKDRLTYFPWFSDFALYLDTQFKFFLTFFQIMSKYDQIFDPSIQLGHCHLISRFSDFALYLDNQSVYFHMYDQTFDPNIHIGHCDLISRFSDFALYLGTQLVYEQASFTLCLRMTRPLTLK